MRIGIVLDDMGHFRAVSVLDRPSTIKMLKEFDGGDYWSNMIEDQYPNFEDTSVHLSNEEWLNIIREFEQRGTFEIVDL